jgi:hypothetical protein
LKASSVTNEASGAALGCSVRGPAMARIWALISRMSVSRAWVVDSKRLSDELDAMRQSPTTVGSINTYFPMDVRRRFMTVL